MTLKHLQSSKNEINDPKRLANKTYTMTKGRETFTVSTQSQSPVVVMFNMFEKGLSFGSKDYIKELKTVECTNFLGQTS